MILVLIFGFFTGIVISLVFQLAHTVESTQFPKPDETTGKVQDEWAVHQLKTTANFATNNKIISWFTGGLNFQVEHHLFPNINSVYAPEVTNAIKNYASENGFAYRSYTLFEALNYHYKLISNK